MPERVQVVAAVGRQCYRGAAVEVCAPSVHVVEVRAPFEEQHAVCCSPHRFVEHRRLGARRDQGHPVSVGAHPPQPLNRLAAERRVAPHPPGPRQRQAVVSYRVVLGRRVPRSDYWRARVKVEGAECPQDLGRRQPLVVSAVLLVRTQTHLTCPPCGTTRRPTGPAAIRPRQAGQL